MKKIGSFFLGLCLAVGSLVLGQVPISGLPNAVLPLTGTERVVLTQNGVGCPPAGCTRQALVSAFASPVNLTPGSGITLTPSPILGTGSVALTAPVTAALGGTGELGTVTGLAKANGASAFTAATSPDITNLFSGCSSGSPVLTFNGTCTSNAGNPISIGKSLASSYTPSISNPTTMTWAPVWQRRENGPYAPYMQQSFDPMVQDAGLYTRSGNLGTWSFSNGQLSVSSTSNSFGNGQNIVATGQSWPIPFSVVSVENIVETTDSGANVLGAGLNLGSGTNNQSYAYMEIGSGSQNRITIADIIGGSFSIRAQTGIGSLPAGITGFAYQFEMGGVLVWIQVGNNSSWYPVLTFGYSNPSPWAFLTPSTTVQAHPFFQITGGTTTPWKIGGFRTGVPGYLTFRDWKVVSNSDGTPYVSNGLMYFTSDDGLSSVYSLNPATGELRKVGILVPNYGGGDNADQNVKIIWDGTLGLWRVLWATWHNGLGNNVKLMYATYSGDILNGMHRISGGVQIAVTQASGNAIYDEDAVFNGTNWDVTYVVSPGGSFGGNFYLVHDQTSNFSTFSNIWAASGTTGYEGSAIAKIGGNFYVTGGNGSQIDIWNMSSGTPVGSLNISPFPSPAGNPPPHFVIFPWMDNGVTSYYALSWNNTHSFIGGVDQGLFSGGTLMLYQAAQTESGFELPALGVR